MSLLQLNYTVQYIFEITQQRMGPSIQTCFSKPINGINSSKNIAHNEMVNSRKMNVNIIWKYKHTAVASNFTSTPNTDHYWNWD